DLQVSLWFGDYKSTWKTGLWLFSRLLHHYTNMTAHRSTPKLEIQFGGTTNREIQFGGGWLKFEGAFRGTPKLKIQSGGTTNLEIQFGGG
ncbi:MAG: hypothetical protein IJH83_00205, partial [Coriobacteriales bacterium]|nr:hypothetical protein [Coriobacteriales bacterium]